MDIIQEVLWWNRGKKARWEKYLDLETRGEQQQGQWHHRSLINGVHQTDNRIVSPISIIPHSSHFHLTKVHIKTPPLQKPQIRHPMLHASDPSQQQNKRFLVQVRLHSNKLLLIHLRRLYKLLCTLDQRRRSEKLRQLRQVWRQKQVELWQFSEVPGFDLQCWRGRQKVWLLKDDIAKVKESCHWCYQGVLWLFRKGQGWIASFLAFWPGFYDRWWV